VRDKIRKLDHEKGVFESTTAANTFVQTVGRLLTRQRSK
jgi:hypothetical protein